MIGSEAHSGLWVPDETGQIPLITAAAGAPAAANYASYDEHKARTPPPDLPSLLLDNRITFLGMPVCLLVVMECATGGRWRFACPAEPLSSVKVYASKTHLCLFFGRSVRICLGGTSAAVGASRHGAYHRGAALSAVSRQEQAHFSVHQLNRHHAR